MPTLLVADDSITVQRVIALTFANEQIRVVAVSDGMQAVERMKTLHPDIVLAGTVLPQVSGYDLAKHMRTIPGLRNVPVLLLDTERFRARGGDPYVNEDGVEHEDNGLAFGDLAHAAVRICAGQTMFPAPHVVHAND